MEHQNHVTKIQFHYQIAQELNQQKGEILIFSQQQQEQKLDIKLERYDQILNHTFKINWKVDIIIYACLSMVFDVAKGAKRYTCTIMNVQKKKSGLTKYICSWVSFFQRICLIGILTEKSPAKQQPKQQPKQ